MAPPKLTMILTSNIIGKFCLFWNIIYIESYNMCYFVSSSFYSALCLEIHLYCIVVCTFHLLTFKYSISLRKVSTVYIFLLLVGICTAFRPGLLEHSICEYHSLLVTIYLDV